MPSRKIILTNDQYYHVYNRGVNKSNLFEEESDYMHALSLIKFYNYVDYPIRFSKFKLLHIDQRREIWERLKMSKKFVDITSYCLMPNHFHLLIKQNQDRGISKFMANFQNSYTKYFNIKYEHSGHLLQGQFKSKQVDSEDLLLHLSRYIHLNPYSSGVVNNFESLLKYKWSSLQEYINNKSFYICNKEILNNYLTDSIKHIEFLKNNAEYQKYLDELKHVILE